MQYSIRRIYRLLTLIMVLITAVSCDSADIEEEQEPTVRPVKMLTLSPASDVDTSRYPVTVSAGQFSELSFQVGGLIEAIAVDDAQEVSAGDMIARLDQRDFQSQLATARAQFQNAEEEYQRGVRLAEGDAIATSVLEQRQAQRDVARAQLDAAEKALEDTTLRAPFTGVIAEMRVRERETIAAGQEVAALINLDTLEVVVNLPARVIAESQEVEDRGAFVILEAAPDNRIEATFKEASLLADTASQTYAVTFTFEPPGSPVILPGMNATIELSSARQYQNTRKSVPLTAIVSDGDSTYVWLVDRELMTVSRREVTIADGIGETAVVTEGLAPGDTIATAGASFLADGMQVRPWSE
ncbi:MAG: efflux RND transporter periplasmic adaptor subunit [Gammaproteobacteria bacterium]